MPDFSYHEAVFSSAIAKTRDKNNWAVNSPDYRMRGAAENSEQMCKGRKDRMGRDPCWKAGCLYGLQFWTS